MTLFPYVSVVVDSNVLLFLLTDREGELYVVSLLSIKYTNKVYSFTDCIASLKSSNLASEIVVNFDIFNQITILLILHIMTKRQNNNSIVVIIFSSIVSRHW